MSDQEIALGLLKLALEKCPEALTSTAPRERFLQLYRELLAEVRKADRA
ncbi:MAG: hypothetical protein IJK04_01400 [Kiritimatiellae bacterium]|nr:hypothetical protein [Kiritimatiellia bacterium]